jgi:hypothetical protein
MALTSARIEHPSSAGARRPENHMERSIHPHHYVQRDRCDRTRSVFGRPRFEPLGSDGAERAVELLAG